MSSLPPVNPMNGPLDWDDTPYREDFRSRYPGEGDRYEEHDPAYRYGHEFGSDPRFRDLDWETAETDLRSGWETRHPDSPWERFKDSVRHAWQRIRS